MQKDLVEATNVSEIPGLEKLWGKTLGDPRICIALLDGAVNQSYPSLAAANLTKLKTLSKANIDQGSATQHGTHVASVIFAQHDGPVKGIAPNCRGLIVPVFAQGAAGSIVPSSQLELARAISQSVQEGAQIINIIGGELTPSGPAHPLLADAVQNCAKNGILIVAAAGNQGCDCLHIPGALPSVLAVGAMNSKGLPLDFSNWGEQYQTQGILAPGEDILGATHNGGTVTQSGTSYATPIVAGIVALLLSLQLKQGQKPNPFTVRAAMLGSAVGCEDQPVPNCRRLLAGRLNIKAAFDEIIKGGIAMSDLLESQENTQSEVTQIVNDNPSTVQMQTSGIQGVVSKNRGFEESDRSPQLSTASTEVSEGGEKSMNQGVVGLS